jgi:ribosome-associated protein
MEDELKKGAVLPQPIARKPAPSAVVSTAVRVLFHRLEDEALLAQCDVQVHRAGGPGGQHRNKTETAVRLVHLPTGVTAEGKDQRSRTQNMSKAVERLREKLELRERPRKKRKATRPSRASKERRLDEKKRNTERKKFRAGHE